MRASQTLILSALMFLACAAGADPLPESEVPAPLRTWIPWVLHDADDRACPYLTSAQAKQCIWPGSLHLELGAHGGRFALRVEAFRSARLSLPGDAQFWPQEVVLDGKAAPVVAHEGLPAVMLT